MQVVLRPARGNWRQDALLAPKQPELGMRHLALEVLHLPTYCCNNVINVQNAPSLLWLNKLRWGRIRRCADTA